MSEELYHTLELNQNCITFEPVSKTVSVFYDENNRQVCYSNQFFIYP